VLALDQSTASILAQSNVSHLVDAICGRDANNIVKQRQCSQQRNTGYIRQQRELSWRSTRY
jgi:hypothetical protein